MYSLNGMFSKRLKLFYFLFFLAPALLSISCSLPDRKQNTIEHVEKIFNNKEKQRIFPMQVPYHFKIGLQEYYKNFNK